MSVPQIIGFVIIIIGLVFQFFGVLGILRNHDFYSRLAVGSLIDSAGFITILIGLMVYVGFRFATLKIAFILLLILLLNPLSNHVIGRGAYLSNYHPEERR